MEQNASIHFSLGSCYLEINDLENAIVEYESALQIDPNYIEAFNNLAVLYKEKGNLFKAIKNYETALEINPAYPESVLNLNNLNIQLYSERNKTNNKTNKYASIDTSIFLKNPNFLIQEAIKSYIVGNFNQTQFFLSKINECENASLKKLSSKDFKFLKAFYKFLSKLLKENIKQTPFANNKIFHIGESHCLSYAHRSIAINGHNYTISPLITFGAKAFHFTESYNSYQSITEENLKAIPPGSLVFISFGEIDCRMDEGFIPASQKLNIGVELLIKDTLKAFFDWFEKVNIATGHQLIFFNVPAPCYKTECDNESNTEVSQIVRLFNKIFKVMTKARNLKLIDIYSLSQNESGFSNLLFHIDDHHLGGMALSEIHRQLNKTK